MERMTKEGKDLNKVLLELMEEYNISKEEFLYTVNEKKGKLFGTVYEVNAYLKTDINKEIKKYIEEIIVNMNAEVTIELANKDERPTFRVYTNCDSLLIGREGNNLKAIDILVKQRIQNETGLFYKFNIDIGDYKEKSALRLEKLAKRTAREVLKTKVAVSLDNMSSYDRRIVHNALSGIEGISSESEGEEPNRHIVIKPIK